MGWGKIAQEHDFKLGPVMSAMKSGNKSLAVSTAPASKGSEMSSASGQTSASPGRGIVASGGKAPGK